MSTEWDKLYKNRNFISKAPLEKIIYFAEKHKDKKIVLDLGCGIGKHSVFLTQQGFNVEGIDISSEAISKAKAWSFEIDLDINYFVSDIFSMSYFNNTFDAVISTYVIDHGTKEQVQVILNEIHRILKPNGLLITDMLSIEDDSFGGGVQVEENTFRDSIAGEEGLLHHYMTPEKIREYFQIFNNLEYSLVIKEFGKGSENYHVAKYYDIYAQK